MTPEQQLLIQHPETIIECKMVEIIRDLESELKAGAHMLAKMHDENFDLQKRITDLCAEIAALKSELVSLAMRYEEEKINAMDAVNKENHKLAKDNMWLADELERIKLNAMQEMDERDAWRADAEKYKKENAALREQLEGFMTFVPICQFCNRPYDNIKEIHGRGMCVIEAAAKEHDETKK